MSLIFYMVVQIIKVSNFLVCFRFFFKIFVWTKVHFVDPLIAPVLDFVCPSSWVSNPEWISHLHSFLLACCDPEGHNWCDTCLFHQIFAEAEARRTVYFPCKDCVEGFNTKIELDKHITDKHIFICSECLKTFKIKAERDAHMKTDHKDVSTERTKQEKLLAEEYRKRESRKEKDRRATEA